MRCFDSISHRAWKTPISCHQYFVQSKRSVWWECANWMDERMILADREANGNRPCTEISNTFRKILYYGGMFLSYHSESPEKFRLVSVNGSIVVDSRQCRTFMMCTFATVSHVLHLGSLSDFLLHVHSLSTRCLGQGYKNGNQSHVWSVPTWSITCLSQMSKFDGILYCEISVVLIVGGRIGARVLACLFLKEKKQSLDITYNIL